MKGVRALGTVILVAVAFALTAASAAQAIGNLVYMGADPSCHWQESPSVMSSAVTLTRNAVQFAGKALNPAIGLVEPGDCSATDPLLAAAGFTNITVIASANLASTNLSVFQVLWIGAFPNLTDLAAAATNVQNFVNAGGGLVLEPENGTGAWLWAPFGNLIGGNTNDLCEEGVDTVTIVTPNHFVMRGLTSTGLSNWDCSVHSDFATPGDAGFTTLTVSDETGNAHIIALGTAPVLTPPAQAPALSWSGMAALMLMLFGAGVYRLYGRRIERSGP